MRQNKKVFPLLYREKSPYFRQIQAQNVTFFSCFRFIVPDYSFKAYRKYLTEGIMSKLQKSHEIDLFWRFQAIKHDKMHRIENKKFGKYTFAPLITYHKIEVVRVHMTSKVAPQIFLGGSNFGHQGGGLRKNFFPVLK